MRNRSDKVAEFWVRVAQACPPEPGQRRKRGLYLYRGRRVFSVRSVLLRDLESTPVS